MEAFLTACQKGDINFVKNYDKTNTTDILKGFNEACYGGHLAIAKYLHSIYKDDITGDDYNYTFKYSCYGEHLDILKHVFSIKENKINLDAYYEYAFKSACNNEHFDIIEYLLRIPHNNISTRAKDDYCLFICCREGYDNVVNYLLSIKNNNGDDDEDTSFTSWYFPNNEIIKLLLDVETREDSTHIITLR